MGFSKTARLGIISCPGGRHFSKEIVYHLKRLYMKRFDRKATRLSEKYGIEKEEVIHSINMNTDLRDASMRHDGPVDAYSPPEFEVPVKFTRFANGEFKTELQSSVRGMKLYIVQDVENHYPVEMNVGEEKEPPLSVNDHIFLLLVTVDAVLQAGAKEVTVVTPTYPYSRQHKKSGREGLTASRLGQTLENMGVARIITLDIHSKEIENSFNHLRLEDLHASYQVLRELARMIDLKQEDLVVVSPDTGAIGRNKFFASSLHRPLAVLYKERDYSKVTKDASDTNITTTRLLGNVENKSVFMADDMLGTGGTMIKAMKYLIDRGAKKIISSVSLPFFTGNAIEKFEDAYQKGYFYRMIGTNAVYQNENLLEREWYVPSNISNLFARVILRLHHNLSLSKLLDNSAIIQHMLNEETNELFKTDSFS